MSDHPSLSPKCPHGVMLEYARCMQCEDPAFHAAQQPPVNVRTMTIGGQAPVLTKQQATARLRTLIAEIWSNHRDADHEGYNECDDAECCWCEDTRKALAVLESPDEPPADPMPAGYIECGNCKSRFLSDRRGESCAACGHTLNRTAES